METAGGAIPPAVIAPSSFLVPGLHGADRLSRLRVMTSSVPAPTPIATVIAGCVIVTLQPSCMVKRGSTRAARRAGRNAAMRPTAMSRAAVPSRIRGSDGLT